MHRTTTAEAAASYVQRGWPVIPLHHVTEDGHCSCLQRQWCKSVGKHPTDAMWQRNGITVPLDALNWFQRGPHNVGILTGLPSGVWVLDVDPEHDGGQRLAELIETHEPLPRTFAVKTGSGGAHYYWRMPSMEITNSRGRLPAGLDVRGTGGYVVAAPSVSGKGDYEILHDGAVLDAPSWLVDLIRSRPWVPLTGERATSIGGDGHAYAKNAIGGALGDLARAVPGERNNLAFGRACRIMEIVNAPWSGIAESEAYKAFMTVCQKIDSDGHFPPHEAHQCWVSATRRTAGKEFELPALAGGGTVVTDLLSAAAASAGGGRAALADFDYAGQGPAGSLDGASAVTGSSESLLDAMPGRAGGGEEKSPLDKAIEYERNRRKARKHVDGEEERQRQADAPGAAGVMLAKLKSSADLNDMPEAVPLIDGWLALDGLARLYGPSNHGKTFVMIDMASCVANGIPWHGRQTRQSKTVYVFAEGGHGVRKRVRAWEHWHGQASQVMFFPEAVQIMGDEWAAFVEAMKALGVEFIILDTQARMTSGVNENDNSEMSEVVTRLDELRSATGACVTLVHHTGVTGGRGRGASSVLGAMDYEHSVSRERMRITVENGKAKDEAQAEPIGLNMCAAPGGSMFLAHDGETIDNHANFSAPIAARNVEEERAIKIASIFAEFGHGVGMTKTAVKKVYMPWDVENREKVKDTSRETMFDNAWNVLKARGRLIKLDRGTTLFGHLVIEGELDPLAVASKGAEVPDGWIQDLPAEKANTPTKGRK